MATGNLFGGPFMATRETVGEAAAISLDFDFTPARVEVINVTQDKVFVWVPPHGAGGYTVMSDTDTGDGSAGDGFATDTSDGITVGPGGVTLGTAIQTTSDVLYVTCWRN